MVERDRPNRESKHGQGLASAVYSTGPERDGEDHLADAQRDHSDDHHGFHHGHVLNSMVQVIVGLGN